MSLSVSVVMMTFYLIHTHLTTSGILMSLTRTITPALPLLGARQISLIQRLPILTCMEFFFVAELPNISPHTTSTTAFLTRDESDRDGVCLVQQFDYNLFLHDQEEILSQGDQYFGATDRRRTAVNQLLRKVEVEGKISFL